MWRRRRSCRGHGRSRPRHLERCREYRKAASAGRWDRQVIDLLVVAGVAARSWLSKISSICCTLYNPVDCVVRHSFRDSGQPRYGFTALEAA